MRLLRGRAEYLQYTLYDSATEVHALYSNAFKRLSIWIEENKLEERRAQEERSNVPPRELSERGG